MAKKDETPSGTPPHDGGKGNPPPPGMAEVHEQLFRVPKHGNGKLKVGGTNPGSGRPRNQLREMVETIGLHLAAPRLAHIIATTKDEGQANSAAATILRHALPANVQVEGELVHKYIAVVPVKAKSTREWLALHAKGKA